jgi:hypothetical protein
MFGRGGVWLMEGVRSLDEIYAFYHEDETANDCRSTMLRFLDLVADVLRSKPLYYSTSHARLGLSRYDTWAEKISHPSIMVSADARWVSVTYSESWDDGPFFRSRDENIRCLVEHGRAALLEMLARLRV